MSWNKKLQRFKRKWRTRGLNEEEIATLINKKNHDISEQSLNESMMNDKIETLNKRKRSSSQQKLTNKSLISMSQSSISQGDALVQIIESNERDNMQKSLEEYLMLLKNRIDQHENELMIQSSSCPTALYSLEMIDQRLKESFRLHHVDLVRTVNYQKHKLRDIIYEKRLFNQLSSYHLAEHQAIDQITTIRKKQLNIFEDLTIFEQRILCHSLPKKFDDIPILTYQNLFGNEANKIMQELKRRKLNDQLKNYELKLQHYEDLYQTEINIFESKLIQTSLNHQHILADIFMTLLICYLSHYTNRLIRQIRYKEACVHVKLVRQHRRHLLSKQQIVDVYPQIIGDVSKISLNRIQLDYLSKS
ncbi:unnamed protein product, partial [Rotaria magnacalcarata]